MKTKILFLLLAMICLLSNTSRAQSLDRQVLGAAGNYASASWGALSSTAGEGVINTSVTSSLVITQGFQQPLQSDVAVYEVLASNTSVTVFPVPAADVVNVLIKTDNPVTHFTVNLYDMIGQQLILPSTLGMQGSAINNSYDLRYIANGQYLILVTDDQGRQVKTIKFTKIN